MIENIDDIPFKKFKDSRARWKTLALFWETRRDGIEPLFTLSTDDRPYEGKMIPSLKKLYLETEDTTEYLFVTEVIGTEWEHWEKLCENQLIFAHIATWRKELDMKLRAKALKNIIDTASEGNYNANKLLLDQGWIKDKKKKIDNKEEVKDEVQSSIATFLQRVK